LLFSGPSSDSNIGAGGFTTASELKQGSVMDILGGSGFGKPSTGTSESGSLFGKTSASSSLFGKSSSSSETPPPLSAVFKASGWNCDVCLVNNKDSVDKCVACQTPKPGPAQKTPGKASTYQV